MTRALRIRIATASTLALQAEALDLNRYSSQLIRTKTADREQVSVNSSEQ